MYPVSEFNEFEPRLKSSKNRFQLSAGLNLKKFNIILSGINSASAKKTPMLSKEKAFCSIKVYFSNKAYSFKVKSMQYIKSILFKEQVF